VAYWSTKATISLKRVKIEEKLLRRAYRNSPTLFRTVPSSTTYSLLFPKIGGSQPQPKTAVQSLLSQERVKLRTSNFVPLYPILVRTFMASIRTKAHKNFPGKLAVAYSGTLENFQGLIYKAHRAVIFAIAQSAFLF